MSAETSSSLDSVKIARTYVATRDDLWKRIAAEHYRELWWPSSTLELANGGKVSTTLHRRDGSACQLNGTTDVYIEGHALGFTWRRPEERDETSVLMTLTSLMGTTQLSVLEIGFRALPESNDRISDAADHWQQRLEALSNSLVQPVE